MIYLSIINEKKPKTFSETSKHPLTFGKGYVIINYTPTDHGFGSVSIIMSEKDEIQTLAENEREKIK